MCVFLMCTVIVPSEIYMIMGRENLEVAASGVIAVESHAPVALYAAVHLMVDKGAELLISVRALLKAVSAVRMAGHHGHVLEMAFTPLVAHRTIVGMVGHKPFDYG